jgi:hypothetical protein
MQASHLFVRLLGRVSEPAIDLAEPLDMIVVQDRTLRRDSLEPWVEETPDRPENRSCEFPADAPFSLIAWLVHIRGRMLNTSVARDCSHFPPRPRRLRGKNKRSSRYVREHVERV